jgi:hypothetical protein
MDIGDIYFELWWGSLRDVEQRSSRTVFSHVIVEGPPLMEQALMSPVLYPPALAISELPSQA